MTLSDTVHARLPLVLFAVLLAQAVVLAFVRSGTSFDGAEQLLYTQYLDWGYGRSQPPLYTWMLWGVQRVFGVSLLAEHVLKFGLMAAGLSAIWLITRRLGGDAAVAAAAVAAAFLVVEIGWEFQRNYAHSVLLLALTGALALAYIGDRILLCGLIAGLMVLSKYNAGLVFGALILADILTRRAFLSWRGLGAVVLGLLVCVPHAVWAVTNAEAVFALTDGFVSDRSGLTAAWGGLAAYGIAAVGVFILLVPFAILAGLRGPLRVPQDQPMQRTLWLWAWAFWGLTLLLAMVAGLERVNMRWLLPGFVPFLPMFAILILNARPGLGPWLRGVGLALAVLFTGGQWFESTHINARTDYAYGDLTDTMAADDLPNTLVIVNYPVLANLRLYGDFDILHQAVPEADRLASDRMVLVTLGADPNRLAAWAETLGACLDGEPYAYDLARRTEEGSRPVVAQVVSRAACNE